MLCASGKEILLFFMLHSRSPVKASAPPARWAPEEKELFEKGLVSTAYQLYKQNLIQMFLFTDNGK